MCPLAEQFCIATASCICLPIFHVELLISVLFTEHGIHLPTLWLDLIFFTFFKAELISIGLPYQILIGKFFLFGSMDQRMLRFNQFESVI